MKVKEQVCSCGHNRNMHTRNYCWNEVSHSYSEDKFCRCEKFKLKDFFDDVKEMRDDV